MLSLLFAAAVAGATATEFDYPQEMPALAKQVLAAYHEDDREKDLDNRFRLQLVAGANGEAAETMVALRQLLADKVPGGSGYIDVQYEMLARARAKQSAGETLEHAYADTFRATMARLDDLTSALVLRSISAAGREGMERSLKRDQEKLKGKTRITMAEALQLLRDDQVWESYNTFTPLATPLIAEDDARRYVIVRNQAVKTTDGASVCATIVRPRVTARIPSILEFTIYADNGNFGQARQMAAHGYAGIEGLTRGKGCSSGPIVPYVHDGADAAALIDWIAAQPWSDGRVAMMGGSYNGFATWAAAGHLPKALKAIVAGAPAKPGYDVPMEGNVVWNFIYPWPFYTTDFKDKPDDALYGDYARWTKLNHEWYVSGRAYRDLDKIDGKPNPIFDEWISHPSYDAYWKGMIAGERALARLNIPVLQTAGYYYGGPGAAVPYFIEHLRANPKAQHYLLIGPYHHFGAQVGVVGLLGNIFPSLSGMTLDPVALINIEELRYQFFDHVLKNRPMPELLQDRVNYEVTGANVWKHAHTLEAMAGDHLRLHLASSKKLAAQPDTAFTDLKVNLADRSDADRTAPGGGVIDTAIDTANGLEFISDPLPAATEMSGLFSGHLDFTPNKKDFDFEIDLYELTPKGEYVQLAPYWSRASYAGHPERRTLLEPGKRQHLDFRAIRLMSRQLQAGSRVVLVLSVIQSPERQINYGSGKDVSAETIADAGPPLEIRWYGDSFIDLPVWRAATRASSR